jgi:hypothetical protein
MSNATTHPTGLISKVLRPFRPEQPQQPQQTPGPVVRDTITRLELHPDGSATRYVFDPAAPEGERETVTHVPADEVGRMEPHRNPTPAAELLSVERQVRGLDD